MQKIQEKWFGAYSISKTENNEKATFIIISSIAIIALLSYIFYGWNRQLKNEVKKRTKQLNLSRNNLIETFDGFTDYLVVVDKNRKVILANRSLCDKIDKTREDIIGKDYGESIDLPFWDYAKGIIKDTFQNGYGMTTEYKYNDSIFSITTFPIREGSELERVLTVIKDITSVKISEKMIVTKTRWWQSPTCRSSGS